MKNHTKIFWLFRFHINFNWRKAFDKIDWFNRIADGTRSLVLVSIMMLFTRELYII